MPVQHLITNSSADCEDKRKCITLLRDRHIKPALLPNYAPYFTKAATKTIYILLLLLFLICFIFIIQEFQVASNLEASADPTNPGPAAVPEGDQSQEENEPYADGDALDFGPEAWSTIEAFLATIANRQKGDTAEGNDDGLSAISEGSFPE